MQLTMLPGNSIVYTCPHCGTKKAVWDIMSGNTFNTTLWSDCKRHSPMMEVASFVQRCPSCKHYFMTSTTTCHEANSCYTFNRGELPYSNLKEALDELQAAGLTEKDEFTVRLMVLHAYNDLYGTAECDAIPAEERQYIRENILRLIPLCQDNMLKAELYREIGDFKMCISILPAGSTLSDFLRNLADDIRKRCMERDAKVFVVNGKGKRNPVLCADDEEPYDPEEDKPEDID